MTLVTNKSIILITGKHRQQQITTARKQISEFDCVSTDTVLILFVIRSLIMKVTALIFPFGEIKTIGKKGIAFRCVTSCRKAGKQSEKEEENYISRFYDCKTFSPDVAKVLNASYDEAKSKYKGIDIEAYAEINQYTDKNGNHRENVVFNIQSANIHKIEAPF